MACVALTASAQFEAGKNYVNLSTSALGLSYSKANKVRFNLGAAAGRFLTDDWMLLGQIGYDHQYKVDNLEIGVGGRYYIEQNGLYLGLGAQYAHNYALGASNDNFFITPEVGYAFFVTHFLTIEPAVYFKMSCNEFSNGSTVGLKVGVGFYF